MMCCPLAAPPAGATKLQPLASEDKGGIPPGLPSHSLRRLCERALRQCYVPVSCFLAGSAPGSRRVGGGWFAGWRCLSGIARRVPCWLACQVPSRVGWPGSRVPHPTRHARPDPETSPLLDARRISPPTVCDDGAMPIHPDDRSRYPPDWPEISRRIRDRAGGRCECGGECGLHRGRRCEEVGGEAARWARGRVVLTVAHLDHTPENCDEGNLRAMCQRCHLRYDVDHHRESRLRRRREAEASSGQGFLF